MSTEAGIYKCDYCSKVIVRSISHLQRNKYHFCNRDCRANYKNPNARNIETGNTGLKAKEYQKIHQYLVRVAGRASRCDHCKVEGKSKYEWALKKGCVYDFDINNFIPLCCSCHRKYDYVEQTGEKIRKKLTGKAGNRRRKIRVIDVKSMKEFFFDSIKDAGEAMKVSETAASNALKGRSKRAGGFIWQYQ